MKRKTPSPDFLHDLTLSVGRVIIGFAILEHVFTLVLARILKLTHIQERALVRPMSITNKTTLLRTLHNEYGKRGSESERWLKFLLKDIRHCADRRNELAHSFYGHRQGKFALLTFSETAKLAGQPLAWTPTELQKLADRIDLLQRSLQDAPRIFPSRLKRPKLRPASVPSVSA